MLINGHNGSSHLTLNTKIGVYAGGGMTVALSDTKLLYDMLRPLSSFSNPTATSQATARFYTERKPMSATINTLANALYRVCFPSFTCQVSSNLFVSSMTKSQ